MRIIDGEKYCIHGHSGYNLRAVDDVPFLGVNLSPAASAANSATASVSFVMYRMYRELKLYWSKVGIKRKMRSGESAVGLLYIAAMFLENLRICIYLNTISQYLRYPPPTLHQYLNYKN